jgi:glycosyltransferase involved in cell wall biosynthesis
MRENAPWLLKPIAGSEAQRIKRYEGMVVSQFQHTLAVTEPDRQALEQAVNYYRHQSLAEAGLITVVPIAVDTEMLQPIQRQADSMSILTLGTLHYPPNADGIRWFANEVFPLIQRAQPEVTLTIVGKNPPADFLKLQSQNPGTIEVTGYVPDLRPFFERAALTVIAVRAGGGMRVRILEAFALGMPVVTTTVGLEGIEAQPGEHVLVEDEPEKFAEATLMALKDKTLQNRLAENGRRLAETQYDWQVILGKMDSIYGREADVAHV